jgi:DNA-binding IclR family transcriptional regulator
VKTTDRILEFITAQNRPVSLKEIQEALEIKPNLVAGFLVSLCKSNRLTREKLERTNSNGPKMQWFYKLVANPQQN